MKSIIGYGSLLSEGSARETVPSLENFRIVEVSGYKRVFNKVGVVFFSRHNATADSQEIACCSTLEARDSTIICSQFECSDDAYHALYEREHRYDWLEVDTFHPEEGVSRGFMCTTNTDTAYRQTKCASEQEYYERVGQYYSGQLWRNDILPFPRYLAFCLQAAEGQGAEVLDNFLDSSFLADGNTSIRAYLKEAPHLENWREMDTGYSYRR
ncbi:gamma-glutamylcyclotransferase [Neptuniibacter sp. 2_MG-2023]|uniref:gamma-glutamylcyclotransferase n=1 Tax=Neptuniibacter sp. 2_MG-2023 TaxID=3062671 RepID=UPI0026E2CB76|nr:gamma-glutamylcyclotransferase [Neptuniibacter sp. 2_MG-2023]MDO6513073.1 gamma-glutamylcyclotransferase [Neptuniibacter sp. 2_MG-2023]